MIQIRTFDEPVIDKKELVAACARGRFRLADKALYLDYICCFIRRYQMFVRISAEQCQNSLLQIAGVEIVLLYPIVCELKSYIRMCQSYADKFIQDMPELCSIGLEKMSARRHIVKQIFHCNTCSFGAGNRLLFYYI